MRVGVDRHSWPSPRSRRPPSPWPTPSADTARHPVAAGRATLKRLRPLVQAGIDATTGGVCQAIRLVNRRRLHPDRSFTLAAQPPRPGAICSRRSIAPSSASPRLTTPRASSTGSTATCSTPRTIRWPSP
ncbi:MAG: hypothetical protein R2838_13940 [Caldilineaceae bacterium]